MIETRCDFCGHIRRRSCDGKRRYEIKEQAAAHVYGLMKNGKTRGGGLHPYACSFCHGWHVGHIPRRMRQSIASKKEG